MTRTPTTRAGTLVAALALILAAGAADAQRSGGGPPYTMRGAQCVDSAGSLVDISLCKPQDAGTGPKAPPPRCREGEKPCGQTCIPSEAACPIK